MLFHAGRLSVVVLCLTLTGCSGWRGYQHGTEAAWQTAHAVDYLQTRYIVHSDKYREANPLISNDPSEAYALAFFAATGLLHWMISYALPDRYRDLWQAATLGGKITCVVFNFQAGVSLRWD